jgi:hypothetical protein
MDRTNPASGQEPQLQNQELGAPIYTNKAWKDYGRTKNCGMALDTTMDKYAVGGEGRITLPCLEARKWKGKGQTLTACKASAAQRR